jgi:polyhydroxyalkanoate synthesis regulator phasin
VERRTKTKIVVGSAAGFLLAVALGAVGGFAAAEALSDDAEPETIVARANVEPDVAPGDESDSLTAALEFLVDEAVEAGRLTEEEGERLKERLQSSRVPFVLPGLEKLPLGDRALELFDRDFGLFGQLVDLETAASYLGLSESELREELGDGKSLADVAGEQNRSVDGLVQELADDAEERIDDAVDDGRLSEERAARLKDDLEDRIRDRVESELRWPRFPSDFRFEFDPTLEPPRGFRAPDG